MSYHVFIGDGLYSKHASIDAARKMQGDLARDGVSSAVRISIGGRYL